MRVAFPSGVDPQPHIAPLAGALVEARKTCYAKPQPAGFVSAFHVDIKGGKLSAKESNADGACLAKALDGQSVTDTVDASLELRVSVAAK